MTTNEIKRYLAPIHEEMFDSYLCIGFVAGTGKPVLVGDLGNQLKYPENNKKMRFCIKAIRDIIDDDGTQDTEGVGGF